MGLVGLTRVLAVEGARYDIQANAIAPLALTRMTEDIMGNLGEKLEPGAGHADRRRTSPTSRATRPAGSSRSAAGGSPRSSSPRTADSTSADLTAEDVAEQLGRRSPTATATTCPRNLGEETAIFIGAFRLVAHVGRLA